MYALSCGTFQHEKFRTCNFVHFFHVCPGVDLSPGDWNRVPTKEGEEGRGDTPLLWATRARNLQCASILRDAGAKVMVFLYKALNVSSGIDHLRAANIHKHKVHLNRRI